MTLAPLTDGQTAALVTALLGRSLLPADVQALLLDRAGGNPLYAEEFVRLLTDRGLLVPGGHTVRLAAGAEIPFPDTVQALVAARLDTLPPEAKALVHDAAVLGRVFWSGGLAALSRLDDDTVRNELGQLERRQLVRTAPSSAVTGQTEYAFSHAVVRDVAYAQIPRAARARRHRAAAEWLAGVAGERAAGLAELIAHHFTSALALALATSAPAAEIAELREPARSALVLAGDRTIDLDAARASGYYDQALELSSPDDGERARVMVKAAQAAYQATGRLAEAIPAYEHAIAALAAQGDRLGQAGALERLAVMRWSQGDTRRLGPSSPRRLRCSSTSRPARSWLRSTPRWRPAEPWPAGAGGAGPGRAGRGPCRPLRSDAARLRALDARGVARCESGDLGGLDDLRAALDVGLAAGAGYETAVVYNLLVEPLWLTEGPQAALDTVQAALEFIDGAAWPWRCGSRAAAHVAVRPRPVGRGGGDGGVDRGLGARARRPLRHRVGRELHRPGAVLAGAGRGRPELVDRLLPVARESTTSRRSCRHWSPRPSSATPVGTWPSPGRPLDELDRVVRPKRRRMVPSPALADVARVSVAVGRTALARDLADQAWPEVARRHHGAVAARAVLAEAEGRLDAAAALYDQAAEQWRPMGTCRSAGTRCSRPGAALPA